MTHTCLYCLRGGEVLLLRCVDDVLITDSDTNSIETVISQLKNKFEVVGLGEAFCLLVLTI